MFINQDTVIVGAVGSVLTELFKLFPFIRENVVFRTAVTIIVLVVGNLITEGKFNWESLVGSLIIALTTYRTLIQPIAQSTGLRSQK